MSASPLVRLLEAFDRLDADGCAALFAPCGRLRYADGREAEGVEAVRAQFAEYFADLRSADHTVRELWHQDAVWIGEMEAGYVLADGVLLRPVSKVFVARMADEAIADLRVYAAVEPSFAVQAAHDRDQAERGLRLGWRWMPPL